MLYEESLKILSILKAAYPNSYRNMTKADVQALINLWNNVLGDYDYKSVEEAINNLVCTSSYPPSIADIKRQLSGVSDYDAELTEMEAWSMVQKALNNSSYNSEREYNNLPDIIKKCVGSPNMLKEWCRMPTDKVQTVVQSNFMRVFRVKQAAEAKSRVLAPSVASFLEKSNMNMLKE